MTAPKKPKKPKHPHVLRASPDEAHEALRAELLDQDARIDELESALNDALERLAALENPTT